MNVGGAARESLRAASLNLLFGGRFAEHDVSLMSAANVFRALDPALRGGAESLLRGAVACVSLCHPP